MQAKSSNSHELAPHMKRLFPVAYHNDEQLNEEYRRLTHADLADSHVAAVDDALADGSAPETAAALCTSTLATRACVLYTEIAVAFWASVAVRLAAVATGSKLVSSIPLGKPSF